MNQTILQRYVTKQLMYVDSHEAILTHLFDRRCKIETKKYFSRRLLLSGVLNNLS